MSRSRSSSGAVLIIESDVRLEYRTRPVSVPSGLVMVAFASAFVVLEIANPPADAISLVAQSLFALALLVAGVWGLSHERHARPLRMSAPPQTCSALESRLRPVPVRTSGG